MISAESAGFGDGAPRLTPPPARADDAVADDPADFDREPVVHLAYPHRTHRQLVQHAYDDTPTAA